MQKTQIQAILRKKDFASPNLKAVDAFIQGLLDDKIKENKNEPVKPYVLANIEDYSIQRRALSLLESGHIIPNHRCRECNGKGYQLERGDKIMPPQLDTNGKPKYKWFTRACVCLTKWVKPTELKNEPKPVPDVEIGPDKGILVKARNKGKRASAKAKTKQAPAGTGTPGSKKRSPKV